MTQAIDRRFMALALSLGRRGLGRVWPWPSVGCVIVKDGQIVGRGVSDRSTMRHAEVVALAQAGEAARDACVYVTLEPCSHTGTTPPCANALVAAGVSRVVVACGDPNPQVNGAGIAILQKAGIAVQTGMLEDEARSDHAGFLLSQTQNRPFLTLKLATTLDGRIATRTGDSQWITGPQSRRQVHTMRSRHDAILVGAGTVRADNPSLNVRDIGAAHQPIRVIVSRNLDIPTESAVLQSAESQAVWLCHRESAGGGGDQWSNLGVETVACAGDGDEVDLRDMMAKLAKRGLTRVLCEGGGMLAASLLGAELVDELVIFRGGAATGADGLPSLGPLGVTQLSDAPKFECRAAHQIGGDTVETWRPI